MRLEADAAEAVREPARTDADSGAAAILRGLSEAQHQAVRHGEGPLLIIAGAGTGKTTVLTRRIAYLIASKRAPEAEQ